MKKTIVVRNETDGKYYLNFYAPEKQFTKSKDGKYVFCDVRLALPASFIKTAKTGREYIGMNEQNIGSSVMCLKKDALEDKEGDDK